MNQVKLIILEVRLFSEYFCHYKQSDDGDVDDDTG